MVAQGPLNGITIVDLTRVLAGPFCTLLLADLGARVIKVESPGKGDDARAFGPFANGRSAYFTSLNRGKESIALDLRSSKGRRIFEALLSAADVLTENFRPGALARLGYDWEKLHRMFPRLVYASTSGFGQTGPHADRPAYDIIVQGLGGLMSLTGYPGNPPTRVGTSLGDIAAGLFTAVGIEAALWHRCQKGVGMRVDVAMLDCQIAILENAIARYRATGKVPGPCGARHPSIAPFECYESADGFVIIAAGNDTLFKNCCSALGRPELAKDERFSNNAARCENVDALKATIESILRAHGTDHWLKVLAAAGVPCGPINDVAQAMAHPQTKARNMIVSVDDPSLEHFRVAGNPIKLSGVPDPTIRPAAPDLDEHHQAILAELASKKTANS